MTVQSPSAYKAYLLLTVTAACWGANAVLGRLAVDHVSPMILILLRWIGVAILLLFIARKPVRKEWPKLRSRLGYLVLLGMWGFTGFNALFYLAAHSTTAINIGILQGSIPVFVMLGAFVAYRTAVTAPQVIGVFVTLLGVMTVALAGDLSRLSELAFNNGDLLMLLACLVYALYAVGLRRKPDVSAMALFAVLGVAALLAAIPLAVVEIMMGDMLWPDATGWFVVGAVVLLPSFLAQIFFIQGVEMIGPGRAGIFVNLVPVFAAFMAVAFLDEEFKTFHGVALGLVLGGIALAEFGRKH